jgi:hypothetical protein
MATRVINELAERILQREQVYLAAFESDVALLTKQHGAKAIEEAFALIGTRNADTRDHWDSQGHELAVRRGLLRALHEHRERPEDFHPATEI